MCEEARQLVTASFGDVMLHTIGHVYLQQAEIHLGGFFGSLGPKMRAAKHNMQ
jgi:hypothetical protein